MNEAKEFEGWAIVELMGHRRLAGRVSEATIAGAPMLRLDLPLPDGSTATQYYSAGALYALTPTDEAAARTVASECVPEPVNRWELRRLLTAEAAVVDAEIAKEKEMPF